MHYVYDGKFGNYPRQPTLPDVATREVLGTDVGSSLGRRMIAVGPTDEALRREKNKQFWMARQGFMTPRITKHLHEELERREKGDNLEAAQVRLAIAQELKDGKLQDLGKMISEHHKKHPSRRLM